MNALHCSINKTELITKVSQMVCNESKNMRIKRAKLCKEGQGQRPVCCGVLCGAPHPCLSCSGVSFCIHFLHLGSAQSTQDQPSSPRISPVHRHLLPLDTAHIHSSKAPLISVIFLSFFPPQDAESKTPLHHAIENAHTNIISLILSHPALDLTVKDKSGVTPFAAAMSRKNNKAAKAILNRESKAAEQVRISVCCGRVQVVSLLCGPVGVMARCTLDA